MRKTHKAKDDSIPAHEESTKESGETLSKMDPSSQSARELLNTHAKRIAGLMNQATRNWWSISCEFLEAKQEGIKGELFEELCNKVKLGYATATKLIKVAGSSRLREHRDQLAAIDAWSTLHRIATYTDAEFELFAKDQLKSGEVKVITRKVAETYHVKKTRKSPAEILLTIKSREALSAAKWECLIRLVREAEQELGTSCQIKTGPTMSKRLEDNPKWKIPTTSLGTTSLGPTA